MPGIAQRDRFLTFAFAAADLLVETGAGATITFAAGAFRHHLGEAPEAFVGRPLQDLIALEERNALAVAMQLLAARGRLPPTAIRLNDGRGTPFALAGLAPAGPQGHFCLTFGPLPTPPRAAAVAANAAFAQAAAALLRAGENRGALAVIDLPAAVRRRIPQRPGLEEDLDAAMLAGSGGGLTGRLAQGRYGLLVTHQAADLTDVAAGLEAVLLSHGLPGGVQTSSLALDAGALTPMQATLALRHALSSFASHGMAAEGFAAPEGAGRADRNRAGQDDGSATDNGSALGGLAAAMLDIARQAAGVRRAIVERRFDLLYQSIVGLRDRRVHHHEALLRPSGYSVETFIRCAETVGMTEEMDLAVADRVLDALRFSPDARIALNISGLSMQSPRFRQALQDRLDANAAVVPRLMAELTESAEVEDEAEARATLDMLRERGVPICLDDFGAGAAAFRYLRIFPVEWVKVDGAYVQNAVRSERDRSFVASMVDLSLAVGARVIAEQVETEEHAAVMASLGVEMAQGYLFARPGKLPATGALARRAG